MSWFTSGGGGSGGVDAPGFACQLAYGGRGGVQNMRACVVVFKVMDGDM